MIDLASPNLLDQHWHLHLYLWSGWLDREECKVWGWRYLNFWQNVPFLSAGSAEVWLVLTGRTPRLEGFAGAGTEHRTGSNFVYLIILSLSSLAWAGDVENKKMSSHDRSSRWYGVNWVMVHTEYRIHHNNIKSTLHLTTMCHHLALYNLAWANLDKPSLYITGSGDGGGGTFTDKNQTISPMSNLLVG